MLHLPPPTSPHFPPYLPLALVKANMLETSPEHSQCLEARLRIAKVRALVSLREPEFNACHQAGWVYYSAAWQLCIGWWKEMLTYPQDSRDSNVRKQKFLFRVGLSVWMPIVVCAIMLAIFVFQDQHQNHITSGFGGFDAEKSQHSTRNQTGHCLQLHYEWWNLQ